MDSVNFIRLKGIKCNLCPMRTDEEAISSYLKWLNDSEIAFFIGGNTRLYSWLDEENYLNESSNSYKFNIITGDSDCMPNRLIGNCDIRVVSCSTPHCLKPTLA